LSEQFITKAYADSNYAGTGILSGFNTWTGTNAYNTNLPASTIEPTTSSHFTNKLYVDSKAPINSPTFTGSLTLSNGDINCTNINNSNDIYSNLYQRNLSSNNGGYCDLFTNANIDDKVLIGSNVSTTTLNGQSVKIDTDLYTTGITSLQATTINGLTVTDPTSLQATTINGTLTASSIDMYGNYTGMKPINGNYLQFYTLGGFTFNCNTATGFTGSNEALRIDNSAITLNKPTTINGTLTANGVAISTTNGLTTPILSLSDYNQSGLYSGAIFQQLQNMTIRSWNSGASEATNIYFTTMNTAHEQSSTMILSNNNIQLNQPTTITGMLALGGISGTVFRVSLVTGGYTMNIQDNGNMYTAGTFASGNASVGTLECWGNITSREGIYIYAGKTLSANGPINAYSGLNVSSGSTTLQNTTINGTTTLNTNLNLCSGTTAPTTGQLGQRITGTIYFSVTSSFTSVLSTITLTPGTWIIDGQVSFQSSGGSYYQINQYTVAFSKNSLINSTGMAQKSIFTSSEVVAMTGFGNIQYGQLFSETLQQVVSHTANTNYSLLLFMQYNGGSNVMSNVNSYFYATRIA
jgi:hypothetical protein